MSRFARVALVLLVAGCASQQPRPAAEPLRVLVYNIHAGKDAAGVDNLERVADLIRTTKADIVLLQEVDRHTRRSGGVDQLDVLMRLTGMHGVMGKSLDYQGGDYGIATLSRWPITRHEVVPLHIDPPEERAGGAKEPRVALLVETAGHEMVNTHLSASRADTWRMKETEELLRLIRDRRPLVAGGDFNAEPNTRVHQAYLNAGLRDAWLECGDGDALTFPARGPIKRIDYLFLDGRASCRRATVLRSDASDHLPLLVEVMLQSPATSSVIRHAPSDSAKQAR